MCALFMQFSMVLAISPRDSRALISQVLSYFHFRFFLFFLAPLSLSLFSKLSKLGIFSQTLCPH